MNDLILKNEFDQCRNIQKRHPIMEINDINALPFKNDNIFKWMKTNNYNDGIKIFDKNRKITLSGCVDDLWEDLRGRLIVVDYKTTSKEFLDSKSMIEYKQQVSFYAFLLSKKGYTLNEIGYLVVNKPIVQSQYSEMDIMLGNVSKDQYVFNPRADATKYKRNLDFEVTVLPVSIDYSWIEKVLDDITNCLQSNELPEYSKNHSSNILCGTCSFYIKIKFYENRLMMQKNKKSQG